MTNEVKIDVAITASVETQKMFKTSLESVQVILVVQILYNGTVVGAISQLNWPMNLICYWKNADPTTVTYLLCI